MSHDYQLAQLDRAIDKANGAKRAGLWAILIAILGTLVLAPLIPLWALIGIAGILAYVTNAAKARDLEADKGELLTRG